MRVGHRSQLKDRRMDALVRPFFVENRSDEGVQATVFDRQF